jgi:hypothetical protein
MIILEFLKSLKFQRNYETKKIWRLAHTFANCTIIKHFQIFKFPVIERE